MLKFSFKNYAYYFTGILLGLTLPLQISCKRNNLDETDKNKYLEFSHKPNTETIEADLRKAKYYGKGGQPGMIQIAGVIINTDLELDSRISQSRVPGKNKEGLQEKLVKPNNKDFSTTVSEKLTPRLAQLISENSLYNFGCDEKLAADLSKERNLNLVETPTANHAVLKLEAKVIMLCGTLTGLTESANFITFNADEIILNDVNYTQTQFLGGTEFNTNKLIIIGKNKIQTKAIDTESASPIAPWLILNVVKDFSAEEKDSLLLLTEGSNFKENDQTKQ